MEKTHTYPTIPSDDQPDRSAAHNKPGRYLLVQWLGQIHKGITEGHTYVQLPPLRLPTGWSSDQYPCSRRAASAGLGVTVESCLASDWLRGRQMFMRTLQYNDDCAKPKCWLLLIIDLGAGPPTTLAIGLAPNDGKSARADLVSGQMHNSYRDLDYVLDWIRTRS